MAISQVGSATGATSASGSNVSVTKPTGVASGHVLIAFGCTTETTPYFDTVPSGFTQIQTSADADTPNLFRATAWYKVCGGSEPSSYTFGSSGASGAGAPIVVSMTAWSGVNNTSPIADSVKSGGGAPTEPANPSTSVTISSLGRVIYGRASRNTSSSGVSDIPTYSTATSGWSELDDRGAFSGGTVNYGIGTYAQTADATGTQTECAVSCSNTTTDNVYILLALAADGSSGSFAMTLGNATQSFAAAVGTLPSHRYGMSRVRASFY